MSKTLPTIGYAVENSEAKFKVFPFERRAVGDDDVQIDILYTGICHSDIHQAKNEWHNSIYPMIPGHEIVGTVVSIGKNVQKFKVGDIGAVGCLVDSCKDCTLCNDHNQETFCLKGASQTYNSREQDKKTPTYGGYSTQIVVHQRFALVVPDKFKTNLAPVAPLLCAGITTYSPLHKYQSHVRKGKKVAVAGLGGLGHMGVKIAVAMGAEVTVLSTSANKEEDAKRLGAHHFVVTSNEETVKKYNGTFDFVLDTISAKHEVQTFVNLVGPLGVVVIVGGNVAPFSLAAFSLIMGNKTVAGSCIGGIKETQEMLDFCAAHNVLSDVEVINIDDVETAYERVLKSDVKYRFVIDIQSLKNKGTSN